MGQDEGCLYRLVKNELSFESTTHTSSKSSFFGQRTLKFSEDGHKETTLGCCLACALQQIEEMGDIDPFLRSDGSGRGMYTCVLCNTGSMHGGATLRSHLGGSWHQTNLRDKRHHIRDQIQQLGLPRWRLHLKEIWFDHTFYVYRPVNSVPDCAPDLLMRALKKYTKLEKTSLLELSVWKASCLWLDGSGNFSSMQDILDQWAMDESFDPAAYKNERRFTSNVSVIMRGVIGYL